MITIINEFIEAYEVDEKNAHQSLLTYLQPWLIEHINGTDQEYSEFLISKGVK